MDWKSLPPLTALRAFAVYAECGSMTTAGARLNVSHAAISQQIRALEQHLGLTLIERKGAQGALTEAGQVLADALAAGFERIHRVIGELTGADAERPVQITTTPAFAANWLMPRLAEFRARHPDVSLMIDPSPELRPMRPGGIDLAVRYGSGEWPGLEATLLIETPIVIVAAPSLIGGEAVETPADLARYHWMQEVGTNEATEFLERHGAVLDRAKGLTSLPGNLMVQAARDGQGVAVTAGMFVDADVASGRLRLLFEDRRKKGYFLVSRAGAMRASVRAFHRWLAAQARSVEK